MSQQHARSVALVLNLETGHVSPQFHVKFDSKFETVSRKEGAGVPKSKWQQQCYFTDEERGSRNPRAVRKERNEDRRSTKKKRIAHVTQRERVKSGSEVGVMSQPTKPTNSRP